MELSEIRKEIDNVDQQIVHLFEQRMHLSKEVAESKRGTGKAIYDQAREQEKLAKLGAMAENEFNRQSIEELFTQIMSISRKYQYKILGDRKHLIDGTYQMVESLTKEAKVAYQGVPGAFSEQAAINYFGKDVDRFHVEQFEDVIIKVENGEADYGVLPIENSSAGFVNGVYHLLQEHDVNIVDGLGLQVSQALLGVKGATIADIKTVYSHPQALLQTKEYLLEHHFKQISLANTAVSAKKIKDDNDVTQGAVASTRAAEIYDLDVLEPAINTQKDNTTRFVIVAKEKVYKKNSNRISMSFILPHKSGSLYDALGNFIFNGLNMTSIESEPLKGKQWEYRFYITCEGNLGDASVQNALNGIENEALEFKLLGTYEEELIAANEEEQ